MEFEIFEKSRIPEAAALFAESFNSPPWNDKWSADTAARRLELMLDGEAAYGITAFENGEMCGMVLGCFEQYYDGVVYNLREFCVKNSKRGGGLGTKIFSELESRLRQRSVKEITLNTLRGEATEGFYRRCGMDNADMAVMTKKLNK